MSKKEKKELETNSDDWGTPREFFERLDRIYDFTLDPCASKVRPLKEGMVNWTVDDDGLSRSWAGHRVYCNPPYSGKQFRMWCEKINRERKRAELIVVLVPLRKCSNLYTHDMVLKYSDVEIVRGRLDFVPLENQGASGGSPAGHVLCVIRHGTEGTAGAVDTECEQCGMNNTVKEGVGGILCANCGAWQRKGLSDEELEERILWIFNEKLKMTIAHKDHRGTAVYSRELRDDSYELFLRQNPWFTECNPEEAEK